MNIIRKGQIHRLAKGDVVGQIRFIERSVIRQRYGKTLTHFTKVPMTLPT